MFSGRSFGSRRAAGATRSLVTAPVFKCGMALFTGPPKR